METEEPALGALTSDDTRHRFTRIDTDKKNRLSLICANLCSSVAGYILWKPFRISCVARRKITGRPCGQVVGEEVSSSRSISQRIFSGASGMFTLIAA